MHCRICLEPETEDKCYANICACTKSNPMHADCLMDWIKNRLSQRKTEFYKFYAWKLLDCDLCKTPFPEFFECNGKKYNLLSYEKPVSGAYLVIDLFNKEKNTIRGCFVIQKSEKTDVLKIGRGNACEIKLSDISISRNHAHLIFRNNEFVLKDQESKFGTLSLF